MRLRTDPTRPLFTFVDLPATGATAHPGALRAIYDKRLDGVILRGFYPTEAMNRIVERLAEARFAPRAADPSLPEVLGRPIVGEDPALVAYFEDAPRQRLRLRALFEGLGDFEERLVRVLADLSGGLPASPVPGPSGSHCTPATLRVLPEGREIGLHVGNDFASMPHVTHLRAHLDLSEQISFFMPITVPEAGGELIVYGLEHADVVHLMPPAGLGNTWREGTDVYDAVVHLDATAFTPGPGDLLIFDGGRYFHRVSRTVGPRPRRTIGGFIGFSLAGDELHYWS